MKNYITEQDIADDLQENQQMVVTTEYNRPDSWVPFLNTIVINKMESEKKIAVQKLKGSYMYLISKI